MGQKSLNRNGLRNQLPLLHSQYINLSSYEPLLLCILKKLESIFYMINLVELSSKQLPPQEMALAIHKSNPNKPGWKIDFLMDWTERSFKSKTYLTIFCKMTFFLGLDLDAATAHWKGRSKMRKLKFATYGFVWPAWQSLTSSQARLKRTALCIMTQGPRKQGC